MQSIYTKSNNINYKDTNLVTIINTNGTHTFNNYKITSSTFTTNIIEYKEGGFRFTLDDFKSAISTSLFEVTLNIEIESEIEVQFVEVYEVGSINDPTIILPVINSKCYYKFCYISSNQITNGYNMVYRMDFFDNDKNVVIPTNITGNIIVQVYPIA